MDRMNRIGKAGRFRRDRGGGFSRHGAEGAAVQGGRHAPTGLGLEGRRETGGAGRGGATATKSFDPLNARVARDAKETQAPTRTVRMGPLLRRIFPRGPENQIEGFNDSRHAAESSSGVCGHSRRWRRLRCKAVVFGPFRGVSMRFPDRPGTGDGGLVVSARPPAVWVPNRPAAQVLLKPLVGLGSTC